MKFFEMMKITISLGIFLLEFTTCQMNIVNHASHYKTAKMVQCMTICECDQATGLIDCGDLGLTKIPNSFPDYAVTIVLSRNKINSIEKNAFAGLQFLEVLYLNDNFISSVDENSFQGLPSLDTIDLHDNAIDNWSSNITRPLSKTLQVLDLSQNSLSSITASMFSHPMPMLTSLNLEENALREINDFSFSYLTALKILNLKINLISDLNPNGTTLEGLENLEEVYFDFNFFSILPEPEAFRVVSDNLQILSLAGQQRTNSIPSLIFPKLQTFNISFCSIDTLVNFTFVNTPQLLTLDITGNRINIIEQEAFSGLKVLQTLRLSQNSLLYFPYRPLMLVSDTLEYLYADYLGISGIIETPFDDEKILLKNLLFLSFQRTNIKKIDASSFFQNLKQLKTLILSNSRLTEVPSAAIASLTSLETFTFNGNLITILTSSSFPALPSLLRLEINESPHLSFIGDNTFEIFGKHLTSLYVASGSLETLSRYSLAKLDQLEYLDLSDNRLRMAYVEWVEGKPFRLLQLDGNPWDCNCNTTDFKLWLSSDDYINIPYKDEVTCHYPRYIRDVLISDVNEVELTCEAMECPRMCICIYENSKTDGDSQAVITKVDCSSEELEAFPQVLPTSTLDFSIDNNKLTSLSSSNFQNITNAEKLFLSRNSIVTIESNTFSLLVSLRELDLQSNDMYSLPELLFTNLSKLEILKLNHNMLENIQSDIFSTLQQLTFLDLSRNNLDYIHSTTFSGLTNLQDLILSYNFISVIEQDALCPLKHLHNLYMSYNYIYSLDPNLVTCNKFLGTIDIGGNSMPLLDPYFMYSESLSYLKMESGKLKEIEKLAFAGLSNLRTVRLASNYISNISADAFKMSDTSEDAMGDSLITSLDFGSNSLSEFPLKALQPLYSLKALYLNNNPILTLDAVAPSSLHYLPSLISLQLAKTKISDVPRSSIFQYIPTLQTLIMNDCELSKIPFDVLRSLPQLNTLNIDGNPIHNISKDDFPSHSQMRSFSLNFNDQLTKVNEKAFTNLPNLSSIQLSGGHSLSSIAKDAFNGLNGVKTFDISDNSLTTPEKEWFSSFSPGQLSSVSLYNNPWVCDCDAFSYKQWLNEEDDNFNVYTLSVTCDEPMHLKGTRIDDVQDEMICPSISTSSSSPTSSTIVQTSDAAHTIGLPETTTNDGCKHLFSFALLSGNVIISFQLSRTFVW